MAKEDQFARVMTSSMDACPNTSGRYIGFTSSFPTETAPRHSSCYSLMQLAAHVGVLPKTKTDNEANSIDELRREIGMIAHDFNNILTVQVGTIELLTPETSGHANEHALAQLRNASERLTALSYKLMQLSCQEKSALTWIDVTDTLLKTADFCLLDSDIRYKLRINGPWPIRMDPVELNRIVQNLVMNARQAMPSGGTLTILTLNVLDAEKAWLEIYIRDQGCGIPEQDLDHIFDAHYTTKPHGHGLGLAYVKSAVRRFGGTITVTSLVGLGTEFVLRFPALPHDF